MYLSASYTVNLNVHFHAGKYGVSRPFYFFIQPTYWFGQRASSWSALFTRSPTSYSLLKAQSDEDGLSEVSNADFSESTGV